MVGSFGGFWPGVQGREASGEHGDAAVEVEANVGVFVAAVGVGHRGEHQRHEFAVEAGQVGVQVDRCAAGQGGDDLQDALPAARRGVQRVPSVVAWWSSHHQPGWPHGWIHR
jgi:hypothetical protein